MTSRNSDVDYGGGGDYRQLDGDADGEQEVDREIDYGGVGGTPMKSALMLAHAADDTDGTRFESRDSLLPLRDDEQFFSDPDDGHRHAILHHQSDGVVDQLEPFSDPESGAVETKRTDLRALQRRAARLKGLRKRLRDQSAWQRERRERRGRRREADAHEVRSLCVSKSIDLDRLYDEYASQSKVEPMSMKDPYLNAGRHGKPRQLRKFADVVCIHGDEFDAIYVFEYGCMVFWNVPTEAEEAFIREVAPYMTEPLDDDDEEEDDYKYVMGETPSVGHNTITLSCNRNEEKLAVSFAMAQSVRLAVFEEIVESEIAENRHLPRELAATGRISLTATQLSKKIGRIFLERSEVNLHSDILDTPDFFWDHDTFLKFYRQVHSYLEIESRTHTLNVRLLVMKEQLDMLSGEVKARHDTYLEWIIIWLIIVEVVLELGVMLAQLFIHKALL